MVFVTSRLVKLSFLLKSLRLKELLLPVFKFIEVVETLVILAFISFPRSHFVWLLLE
jgi:hypothetical protein